MRVLRVLAAAVLVVSLRPEPSTAQPLPKDRPSHQPVDPHDTCEGCHATATPAAFRAFKQSRHAEAGVACASCHGTPGADFKPKPAASSCGGCHAEWARTAATDPFFAGATCYSCHPAHALNPHRNPARAR